MSPCGRPGFEQIRRGVNFMTEWYKNLYLGKSIKGRQRKILRMLDRGQCFPGLFLITEAANGRDQLDILEASRFFLNSDQKSRPEIFGIAGGHREAVDLVCRIAGETYAAGYGGNLKAYLKER